MAQLDNAMKSSLYFRYHYYCEDISDPSGPKAYKVVKFMVVICCELDCHPLFTYVCMCFQSDDLTRLEVEIALAREQLSMARELMEECRAMQSRQTGEGRVAGRRGGVRERKGRGGGRERGGLGRERQTSAQQSSISGG